MISKVDVDIHMIGLKNDYPDLVLKKEDDTKADDKIKKKKRKNNKKKEIKSKKIKRSSDPYDYFCEIVKNLKSRHIRNKYSGECVSGKYLFELHKNQGEKCFYTGLKYNFETTLDDPLKITIDRIDSKKGYIAGNVVLSCWFVNTAKGIWELEDIKKLWKYLPKD